VLAGARRRSSKTPHLKCSAGLFEKLVPPHLGIALKQGPDPDAGG